LELVHRDTDYAIRAMVLLASNQKTMSVAELARCEQVPTEFLKKIMQVLKNAQFIESVQGPFGGYKLTKNPEETTLYDIITAVQGPIHMNICFANPSVYEGSDTCLLRDILGEIGGQINDYLENVTLEDMMVRMKEKAPKK